MQMDPLLVVFVYVYIRLTLFTIQSLSLLAQFHLLLNILPQHYVQHPFKNHTTHLMNAASTPKSHHPLRYPASTLKIHHT